MYNVTSSSLPMLCYRKRLILLLEILLHCQFCPGPVFFAPVVIDYLFGGISAVKACVEDVPDRVVQSNSRRY